MSALRLNRLSLAIVDQYLITYTSTLKYTIAYVEIQW